MEKLALRNIVKTKNTYRDIRGVEARYWNENVFARPNGLRVKAETPRFRVGDVDLPERRYICNSSRGEEDVDAHMCLYGSTRE